MAATENKSIEVTIKLSNNYATSEVKQKPFYKLDLSKADDFTTVCQN